MLNKLFNIYNKYAPGMTLVTASDSSHARSLLNLLASARRHEPATSVVVYDLGLTSDQCASVMGLGGKLMRFDFAAYPAFLDIRRSAGQYAWKPQILRTVAQERPGVVCWMDAGNVIEAPLLQLRRETARFGYYSASSSGTLGAWTHPGMLHYLGLPTGWKADAANLNGACIAFDTRNPMAADLLERWANLSLIEDCIAPRGSDRSNHRQDQALLTVLAYIAGRPAKASTKLLGYRVHQDVDELVSG
ncbi:hypothetical protein SLT36_18110 [Aminobacter sp. BA135]|uniref:hypothetical protein n=1 Tax=Aminobacter sp. BA135 TaxID=537596 RepID=UPI003D7BD828